MLLKVAYCGGCNPEIDREKLVKDLARQLGWPVVPARANSPRAAVTLLVNGCTRSCLPAKSAAPTIIVAGNTVDGWPVPQEEMLEILQKHVYQKITGGMLMSYTKLIVEKTDNYLVATINNPPANALGQAVLGDLNNLLDECLEDPGVRAIVLTGAGEKLFSGGADIKEFSTYHSGGKPKINGHDVFLKIERYPKPVIAALQGSAYGGGCELALACHLRYMSEKAVIALPEVKLGIIPGWGGTQRLPRLIGKTRALAMMLTGDPISAADAFTYGLVNKVCPADQVLNEARAMAARLAKGAPLAIREILKAVTAGLETTIEQGIKIERAGSDVVFASEDSKEGSRAFFEKRPPNFQGK